MGPLQVACPLQNLVGTVDVGNDGAAAPSAGGTPLPFIESPRQRRAHRLRITCACLVFALAATFPAPPAAADSGFYRYVDHTGAVRVVGSLGEVPAQYRAAAKPLGNSRRIDYQRQTTTLSRERVERASRTAATLSAMPERRPSTIVYSAAWCGYCKKAKSFLRARGVPFEERDIDDPAIKSELIAKTGNAYVPVIERDGERVIGWDPDALALLIR